MNNSQTKKLYGLVLIGGKSTRMGRDKAALVYHQGQTQAQHSFHLLSQVCEKVFFSMRAEQTKEDIYKMFPQIHDQEPFLNAGPMGGILTAMTQYQNVSWLVIACDLPYLTKDVIQYLIDHRDQTKNATAFISSYDGLPEPLCAIYEPSTYQLMKDALKREKTCPRKFLINHDVKLLKLLKSNALDNVNAPDELEQALNRLNSAEKERVSVKVQYYALLREERGLSEETIETSARSLKELYKELQAKHKFRLSADILRVAVNNQFVDWAAQINSGDSVVFIPPVAGG